MDESALLARLRSLTADLHAGDAGSGSLAELRRRLAASLRATPEQAPSEPQLAAGDSCLETELQLAIAESVGEQIPAESRVLFARRLTPLISLVPGATDHPLGGLTASRVFGPFVDELGRPVWFDEFVIGPVLQVAWTGQPSPTLVLPASLVLPGATKLDYSDVSVWIAARALASAAPAGTFSGWKVAHATFEFSAGGIVSGHTLTLPANATCRVTMTPDDSEASPPAPGPGSDAAAASLARPHNAELLFNAAGLVSLTADGAKVNALGNAFTLTRTNDPPAYDAMLARVLIPFDAVPKSIASLTSVSTLCTVKGSGAVFSAAWTPVSLRAAADQLGDAGSGGAFVIGVDGDFVAESDTVRPGAVRLGSSRLFVDRGILAWIAPLATNVTARCTFSMWRSAAITVDLDEPFPLVFASARAGFEMVQYRGALTASVDVPRRADGSKLLVKFPKTSLSYLRSASGLSVFGGAAADVGQDRTGLALSNALLTVSAASQIDWRAQLGSPDVSSGGALELQMGIWQLLPMLPDPYAASFGADFRADAPRGLLKLRVTWTGTEPSLDFTVQTGQREDGSPVLVPQPRDAPLASSDAERLRRDFYAFVHPHEAGLAARINRVSSLRLLDVSSNSDQLGVTLNFGAGSAEPIRIVDADVVSLGGPVEVLMLPQVQWEPVRVIQNPLVGPFPDDVALADDGGPTLIGARTVQLVPIAPLPIASAVVDAHARDSQPAAALFTLPFGIRALASFTTEWPFDGAPATIAVRRQAFEDSFTAATQIRLEASPAFVQVIRRHGLLDFLRRPPLLPGYAVQQIQPATPTSVLEPLDVSFNNTFGPGSESHQVPIERIDLGGYGASLFSNWVNEPSGTGITNVRFEVLVGRTRYEVLRMRSRLIPCDAVVVRTITLERRASGAVFRWDSGWVAVTDGLFEWPDNNHAVRFHTGAVQGFFNIREIRDTPGTIPLAGALVQAVHFDCDIAIDHVVRGATSGNRVPARNQLGFVQLIPMPLPAGLGSPLDVPALNAGQLDDLLQKFDPVGGNVDCVVNIGGSGQEMRLTGVFSSGAVNDDVPPSKQFVVACYGSLNVPRNEQWTMVRSELASATVAPVDPHRGVPLVRRGGTTVTPASGPYCIADPGDLLKAARTAEYGIQLTTRTNRLLFLRPEITPGVSAVSGALPPIVADPFVLAGEGGVFPPLGRCLHLDVAGYALEIAAGAYRWAAPPAGMTFGIPELPSLSRFLVKSGAYDLRADYAGKLVKILANSGAPWSINIPDIPSVLDVHTPDLGKDIIKVFSDLYSPGTNGAPPTIEFGGALKTASDVITALEGFLPGLDTPGLDIDLSAPRLDDPALRLRISGRYPICGSDGGAIDIGIGKFRGELGAGTEIQVGLASVGGRIYFIVQGEIQQPLLPKLLYVGGSFYLEIQIDESGSPGVRLITSAVGSVGGDLIPGLVSVEGSVSYGYFLDTTIDPFVPGVALGMEIRAKLVSGLLGIRFRADVAVGVMPGAPDPAVEIAPPLDLPPALNRSLFISGQFTAQVSVVAAWVFEKDFSKTFRFHEQVPALAAGAFLVGTGLVPIPV